MQIHQIDEHTTIETEDGIVVSVETSAHAQYLSIIGSKYVVGAVHETDITPQLWRSIKLELIQPDGATAYIEMIRPLWWVQQTGATEGHSINLEVTEAGLAGEARILSVMKNVEVDSRDHPAASVVISTIRHENARVLSLVFGGDESSPLGITPNHPLFSMDREDYVPAGELRIGENVKTESGMLAVVSSVYQREKSVPVYNLEVHRVQSYFVGSQRLLAHNTGVSCWKAWAGSALQRNKPNSRSILTEAGRAATKYLEYFGYGSDELLRQVYRSEKALNDLAESHLKEILHHGTVTNGPPSHQYPTGWTTITLPDGRGASWHAKTGKFAGFRGIR